MRVLEASHLTFRGRVAIWVAAAFIFLLYSICLGASAPALGSRISLVDVLRHLDWRAGARSWHFPLLCLAAIVIYSHLSSSSARIGLAAVCFTGPLIVFWGSDRELLGRFGIWIGSVVAAPVLTLGVLEGWWDGEFYTERTLSWAVAGWWMLLWACIIFCEYRWWRELSTNEATGANASGRSRSRIWSLWAARIAQFRR